MKLTSILYLVFFIPLFSLGQINNHKLTTTDSLELYMKFPKLETFYTSGNYDEGCKLLEELLVKGYYSKKSLLYGGKCCFKLNNDSLVTKLFTEEKRSITQGFCRLNWGEKVKTNDQYKRFCEVDLDIYENKLRSVLNLKMVSDTLVKILIEDQGSHLSPGLKNSLITCGYGSQFTTELPDLNPMELNQMHLNIINGILTRHPNLSKQDVGKFGMQAISLTLLHSKLENLEKYEKIYVKLFDKRMQAYYADKILTAKNEAQMYGTQFKFCDVLGKNLLHPVFKIEELNIRRMRMHMPPIEVYTRNNGILNYLEVCK